MQVRIVGANHSDWVSNKATIAGYNAYARLKISSGGTLKAACGVTFIAIRSAFETIGSVWSWVIRRVTQARGPLQTRIAPAGRARHKPGAFEATGGTGGAEAGSGVREVVFSTDTATASSVY